MWKSVVNVMLSALLLWGMQSAWAVEETGVPNSASAFMEWQMMPGESLNALAKLFYPKSTAMQRSFVKAALKLNREAMPDLTPEFKFDENTNIQIPSLIELSKQAPKKRKPRPVPIAAQPVVETPVMIEPDKQEPPSMGKAQAASIDALEQRVDPRQEELDKLNQRLKSLEQETKTLQDSIKANSQPIEEAKGRQLKRVD